MTNELRLELDIALEKLISKAKFLRQRNGTYGNSCAPHPPRRFEDDPKTGKLNPDYSAEIQPENDACDMVIEKILKTAQWPLPEEMAALTPDRVWVWGGPTPLWGGSTADDTLVRGADYFKAENVVYVYGPTTDKMLALHSKYKKMLCQINSNCRTEGALFHSEEENARLLSKLSLKFPNITGAMCDDFCTGFSHILLPERFEKMYRGLKEFNSALKLYGVLYAHELETRNFQLIQPYIDVVNFWIWNKDQILDIDRHMSLCESKFPGKPILMGVFIHEYGRADVGNPPELLRYQLAKAREYLAQKRIEGIVILGDREIKKWPESAQAVKGYLEAQK